MGAIAGVVESIVAAILVGTAALLWKRWQGREIAITNPEENGELPPAENRGGVVAHAVTGTLKWLPKDHRIWLLVVDETRKKVWPQGFEPVAYDKSEGSWKGYVHVWGWRNVTIIAVIAPVTSQEYFSYFQRVGMKTKFEPLPQIPPECKRLSVVHVRVPKAEVLHPAASEVKAEARLEDWMSDSPTP